VALSVALCASLYADVNTCTTECENAYYNIYDMTDAELETCKIWCQADSTAYLNFYELYDTSYDDTSVNTPNVDDTTGPVIDDTIYNNTISFKTGWNFIGFDNTKDLANDSILSDTTKVKLIWQYDNSNKSWIVYSPDNELQQIISNNQIPISSTLDVRQGAWLLAKGDFDYTVSSKDHYLSNDDIILYDGWNLVSSVDSSSFSISDELFNNDFVWTYKDGTWYVKHKLDTSLNPEGVQILSQTSPNQAYWVYKRKIVTEVDTGPAVFDLENGKKVLKGQFDLLSGNGRKLYSSGLTGIGSIEQILAEIIKNNEVIDEVTIPVKDDGSFELEIPTNGDEMIMMTKTSSDDIDNLINNFVSISENDNLLSSIPINNMVSSIDIGKVSLYNDETKTTNSIGDVSKAFSLESGILYTLSSIDGMSKYIKNNILNKQINSNISWISMVGYSFGSSREVKFNEFTDVSSFPNLMVDGIDLIPNTSIFNQDRENIYLLDPDGEVISFELYPSANVSQNALSKWTWDGDFKTGIYKVQNNDNTIAAFDLSSVSFYDQDGYYNGIHPSIRINTNSDGEAIGFDIKFMFFNKVTKKYEQITDINILKRFAHTMWFDFMGGSENMPISDLTYTFYLDKSEYSVSFSKAYGYDDFAFGVGIRFLFQNDNYIDYSFYWD
jgi:hypothetical protein